MIALRFIFSVAIVVILTSCTVTRPEEVVDTTKPEPFDDHELAVPYLSMALANTIGMKVIKVNDLYSIELISDISPAAQSGIETGYILYAINGIDIGDFTKERVERFVEYFADNETVFSVKDESGTEREITVIYNRDNCPQFKRSEFIFISSYDPDNMPSVLHVTFDREIERMTFNHYALNWLHHFDMNTSEWYHREPELLEIESLYDLGDLAKVTGRAYHVEYNEQTGEGTLGLMLDHRLHLRYEISNRFDNHLETLIGPAWLESGPIVFAGHALIRHVTDYYLEPYYVNLEREIKLQLDQDSRHKEDHIQDRLILVDQSGGYIEIEISGKNSNWHGFYFPPSDQKASGIHLCLETNQDTSLTFSNISFNWYENVIEGYESYPYPEEITIELTADDNQIHTLRIDTAYPEYLNNGQKILCVANAAYSCDDTHEHFMSGYLIRIHERPPM